MFADVKLSSSIPQENDVIRHSFEIQDTCFNMFVALNFRGDIYPAELEVLAILLAYREVKIPVIPSLIAYYVGFIIPFLVGKKYSTQETANHIYNLIDADHFLIEKLMPNLNFGKYVMTLKTNINRILLLQAKQLNEDKNITNKILHLYQKSGTAFKD